MHYALIVRNLRDIVDNFTTTIRNPEPSLTERNLKHDYIDRFVWGLSATHFIFVQKYYTILHGAAASERTFTKTLAQSRLQDVLFHLRNYVKIIIQAFKKIFSIWTSHLMLWFLLYLNRSHSKKLILR